MSWTQLAPDRWSFQDPPPAMRHLLLRAAGRSMELHGHTVHVYEGPAEVADPEFPLSGEKTWVLTDPARFDLDVLPTADVWAGLADPRYTAPEEPQVPEPQTPPEQPTPPPPPPTPPPVMPGGDEEEEG